MLRTKMILTMQGYWAVGSGRGGGKEVDNRIDRDSDGLPYVPGKMLKGLIKDACLRLKLSGNSKYNFTDDLFETSGKIFISDARLSPALRCALLKEENLSAKENLTRNIYSTAINNETGTAKKQSLRGYEVTVPMELESILDCDCTKEELDSIKLAASTLVYAIGSHKTRGLGEVVIEFKDEA